MRKHPQERQGVCKVMTTLRPRSSTLDERDGADRAPRFQSRDRGSTYVHPWPFPKTQAEEQAAAADAAAGQDLQDDLAPIHT